VHALDIPVLVVRARPMDPAIKPWDPLGSPTWPGLAAEFPQGRDLFRPDRTHFLPMEDPAGMAALIEAELAAFPPP
jgi:lipase